MATADLPTVESTSADAQLIVRRDGHVVWVTFNRPDKHNALSAEILAGLNAWAEIWNADPDVRVIVLQGAGGKAFISGADIGQLGGEIGASRPTGGTGVTRHIEKPVIALVRGYCLGLGVAIALEADIRIATPDAVLGIPAGKLGVSYPQGAIDRLVSIVGSGHATNLMLTAERITAERALAIGMINEIVDATHIEQRVGELADTIAANAPLTLIAAKLAINAAVHGGQEDDLLRAAQAARACWTSADFAEGRAAFAAKRSPHWTGR